MSIDEPDIFISSFNFEHCQCFIEIFGSDWKFFVVFLQVVFKVFHRTPEVNVFCVDVLRSFDQSAESPHHALVVLWGEIKVFVEDGNSSDGAVPERLVIFCFFKFGKDSEEDVQADEVVILPDLVVKDVLCLLHR